MINVIVAPIKIRGFLKNLFDYKFQNIYFHYDRKNIYESASLFRKIGSRVLRLKIFDFTGIFQVINFTSEVGELIFSYNKLLKTNKPYIIYLENPSAIINYCWDRTKYSIGKRKIIKCLNDKNLKAIICMSKMCYETFRKMYPFEMPFELEHIYPFIPDDPCFSEIEIKEKTYRKVINCLYISSDFILKGGRDLINIFENIQKITKNVRLTIITKIKSIPLSDFRKLKSMDNVNLVDFKLSYAELKNYYKNSCILLHPTRLDSFAMVILEAVKYGNSVICTDVYALNEMVKNNKNGYVNNAMYSWWGKDGFPNKKDKLYGWRYLKCGILDHSLIKLITQEIIELEENRDKLYRFCCNSFSISHFEDFSERCILNKWNAIIKKSVKEN